MKKISLLLALSIIVFSFFAVAGCDNNKHLIKFYVYDELFDSIKTEGNETLNFPISPTKPNCYFLGWYLDKDEWKQEITKESFSNKPLENNISVYAYFMKCEDYEATIIGLKDFVKNPENNSTYYLRVGNSTQTFYLNEYITVEPNSSWKAYSNVETTEEITNPQLSLELGNNKIYIQVSNKNINRIYLLEIYRRNIFTVTFNSGCSTLIESQRVEEDGFVEETNKMKNLSRVGYDFKGWNRSFNLPIIQNTTFTANWKSKSEVNLPAIPLSVRSNNE